MKLNGFRRGPVSGAVVLAGLLAGGLAGAPAVAGAASAAPATSTTFQWTGADSAANGIPNWSDSANWKSGTAPASSTKAALKFPVLSCTSSCNESTNDLTGFDATKVSIALGVQGVSGSDYSIGGNALKMGNLVVTSDVPTGDPGQNAYFGLPITLTGAATWSIDAENDSNFDLGTISGAKDALTITLPIANADNGGGYVGSSNFNVGSLAFQGVAGQPSQSTVTGASFNAKSGNPVTFIDSSLFITGSSGTTAKETTVPFGPLTIEGTSVQLGNGGGNGPYGIDSVDGDASLDAASGVNYISLTPGTAKPVAGVTYPQLKASGSIQLGSAGLGLFAACNQKKGATYTIVSGGSVEGTFGGLANDDVVQAYSDGSASCQASGATPPYLEIKYGASTVTATVVAAPPGNSASVSHASSMIYEVVGHQFRAVRG
jgi:hypothetical protein